MDTKFSREGKITDVMQLTCTNVMLWHPKYLSNRGLRPVLSHDDVFVSV